jgi:uncharacterized protein (DUF952 family)
LPIDAPISKAELIPAHQHTLFPHIYGPLNRQAIIACFSLQRDEAGRWQMPMPADTNDRRPVNY